MADLFQELVDDPDYQTLAPGDQRQVRQAYFDKKVAADAEFQTLDKASQIEVKNSFYNYKPAEQPTLAVGEKLGLKIPIPQVADEYMTRTGRRMHKAGEDLAKFPAAAKRLATARMDKDVAESGIDVLNAAAAPFNFASAPIDAAGETAARGGLGLSEETARNVGDFTSAALGLPAAKLANANKLTGLGRTANEVMLLGEQGKAPGSVLAPGEVPPSQVKNVQPAEPPPPQGPPVPPTQAPPPQRPTVPQSGPEGTAKTGLQWDVSTERGIAKAYAAGDITYEQRAQLLHELQVRNSSLAPKPAAAESVADRIARLEAENESMRTAVEGGTKPPVETVPPAPASTAPVAASNIDAIKPGDTMELVKSALRKQATGEKLTFSETAALQRHTPDAVKKQATQDRTTFVRSEMELDKVKAVLKKQQTGKPLTIAEQQILEKAKETKPDAIDRRAQMHARKNEFDAKNQEIVDDAKMILDDPNSSEYARSAAEEKLAEMGVTHTPKAAPRTAQAAEIATIKPVVPRETPAPKPTVIDTDTLKVTKFQPQNIPQRLEPTVEVAAEPLPGGLAQAKPTYNYGKRKIELEFERDIERAAFIVANKTKLSKADQKYLEYVKTRLGVDDAGARAFGQQVKAHIKEQAAAGNDAVTIPVLQSNTRAGELGMPEKMSEEQMLARLAELERENEQLASRLRPLKIDQDAKGGRQILEEHERAVGSYIERNGKINIPKNLQEEFGAWARRIHDPEGMGVDEMAEELFNQGMIPEPTTNSLLEGLKRGRGSAIASKTDLDDIAVKVGVDAKIQDLAGAQAEILYNGKYYSKAYPAGDGKLKLVAQDGTEKILSKPGDIFRAEEVVPFDVPAVTTPTMIRPALRINDEVYVGDMGKRHDSMMDDLPEGWDAPGAKFEKGWMGANGEFLDEAAMQRKLFADDIAQAAKDADELGMPDVKLRSDNIPQSIDPLQAQYVPPAGGAPVDLVRRGDIIRSITEGLDLAIRKGHANLRGKRGIFKVREEVVRLKHAEDFGAVTHEAGHFISKQVFPNFNKATDPELLALGRALYGRRQPRGGYGEEGLAEFVRLYVTDPAAAQSSAPNFLNRFESVLNSQHPDFRDVLRTARDDWARWENQPGAAHILAQMSIGEKTRRTFTLSDLYTHTINDLNGIEEIVKRMTQGRQLDVKDDPGKLAQLFRGWMGKADLFFHYGTRDFNTLMRNGEGLNTILKPVEGDLNNFRAYLVARRAIELEGKGKLAGALDVSKVHDAFTQLDSPTFRAAADGIYGYQDRLLTYLKDAGFLSDSSYLYIKQMNQNYVPWHRLIESGELGRANKSGKSFGDLWNPVKTLHGSDRAILDPLESIVKNTYAFINLAERNRVGQALARLGDTTQGMGKFVERLPMDTQRTKFNLNEVRKQMIDTLERNGVQLPRDANGNLDRAFLAQFDQMATIFRPKAVLGDNILSVWENGKQAYFELHPDLYKGMMNLDRESSNWMVKVLSAPARLLRVGATVFSPSFALRNIPRDQWSAMVYSKYNFIPGVDFLRGIGHVLKRDDIYEAWKASGGEHAAMVSIDRLNIQDRLTKKILDGGWKGTFSRVLRHPVDSARIFAELSEAGTRVGEFAKGLQKEGHNIEGILKAGFASREVTLDFARRGAYMQSINALSAFLNPNIQDWDKMGRTLFKKDSAGAWAKAIGGITIPSISLYLLNKDDPRYQELPAWQKNLFWIVPRGNMNQETWGKMSPEEKAEFSKENWIWRIPKPFTLGLLFGSVPEQMLEYAYKKDPKAINDLMWNMLGGLPNPMPTAALPLVENFANYSMFRDRPLVPRGKQDAAGKEQFGAYTSETAKFLGRAAETVGVTGGYSPSKIENLIQGYSGAGGRLATGLTDRTFFKDKMLEKPGSGFLSDASETSGFRVNFPGQTESVQRFYEEYGKSQQIKATLDLYKRQGRTQDMRELLLQNRDMIREERRMRMTADTLGKFQKQADRILTSHISGEEKQKKLNAITFRMADLAKRATRKPKVEAPQ